MRIPTCPTASYCRATGPSRHVPYANFIPSPNDPDRRRAEAFPPDSSPSASVFPRPPVGACNYQTMTTDRDNRDGPAGTHSSPRSWNNSNYFGGRIDTLQARADLQLGRMEFRHGGLRMGARSFRQPLDRRESGPRTRVDARLKIDQQSHTAFVQDSIRLLDNRLQITLSGRTQAFRLNQPEFAGGSPLYEGVSSVAAPGLDGRRFDRLITCARPAPSSAPMRATAIGSVSLRAVRRLVLLRIVQRLWRPSAGARAADLDRRGFDQYLASAKVKVSGTYFYTRLQEVIGFDAARSRPDTDPSAAGAATRTPAAACRAALS